MSSKKEREQRLLLYLAKKQEYATSEELAEVLEVSQKTIYRLIKKINTHFSEGTMILSEKGRGYRLDHEAFIGTSSRIMKQKESFSPEERRKKVLEELLFSAPKSKNIYDLYAQFEVGDSAIASDEQIISEKLKIYNLKVERKNRKVAIKGLESNIRKAITETLEILTIIDIEDLRNNKDFRFNRYDVIFVLDQLRRMEKQLSSTLSHPYDVNIFSHLYILIARTRKVGFYKRMEKDSLTVEEKEELIQDFASYRVAEQIIANVAKYTNENLPEIESYYLYQYVVSSRTQASIIKKNDFSKKVIDITSSYLTEMSKLLNLSIKKQGIFLDLAHHIKPMINRLEHTIPVKNSLLEQIKMTYEDLFDHVQNVSKKISLHYQLPAINEDENGFITLYFARVIETHQAPIPTLIMCTTGIGTSELLRVKVNKKFPELEIIKVISSRELKRLLEKYPNVELILTTVRLNESIRIPTLLVSAMFIPDDQTRLQKKIEEIYNGN